LKIYDVAVIGAGITGTAIARELSKYKLKTVLIDKEVDIAFGGATKANTGIIHAGYDDPPGSNRAKYCPKGNSLWPKLAKELEIPFKQTGSFVIAFNEEDVKELENLLERGRKNGVPRLEIIHDKKRLAQMEPHLSPRAVAALWAPTAGIISPYEAAIALAENARENGVEILLETRVEKVKVENGEVKGVETSRGFIPAKVVVNAAGLYADEISRTAGVDYFTIHPRKGEYHIYDKRLGHLARRPLFPTPTPISKGIVVTPTVEGNLLIGPNARDISDKEDTSTTREGLDEVMRGAAKLIPGIEKYRRLIIRNFAGLRAEPSTRDFIVEAYDDPRGFINVAGIRSPGLTSAPAIAQAVAEMIAEKELLKLQKKEKFNPYRKAIPRVAEMPPSEANKLIKEKPEYGHIICRCEHVSEGEVIEAIRRGATTLDGVKLRTRAGMGRCQGGFCTYYVLKILARELDIPEEKVTKRGKGSELFPCKVKELVRRDENAS